MRRRQIMPPGAMIRAMEPWSPPTRPASAPEPGKVWVVEVTKWALCLAFGSAFLYSLHLEFSADERERFLERCVDMSGRHDDDLAEYRRRLARCDLLWEARPR